MEQTVIVQNERGLRRILRSFRSAGSSQRASKAARTLQNIYVLTSHQSMRVVYVNAWHGNVCAEYVTDDARSQPIIRYAVFEKNSKFIEYDLDQEDAADRCNLAGLDLSKVTEWELKAIRP